MAGGWLPHSTKAATGCDNKGCGSRGRRFCCQIKQLSWRPQWQMSWLADGLCGRKRLGRGSRAVGAYAAAAAGAGCTSVVGRKKRAIDPRVLAADVTGAAVHAFPPRWPTRLQGLCASSLICGGMFAYLRILRAHSRHITPPGDILGVSY